MLAALARLFIHGMDPSNKDPGGNPTRQALHSPYSGKEKRKKSRALL